MKTFISMLAMTACLSATCASALTITVDDNIASDMHLSAGSSLTGSFNINPFIPTDGSYIQPYSITGSSATFKFTDNLDALTPESPVSTDYSLTKTTGNDKNINNFYLRYTTIWSLNAPEEVSLNILGKISRDQTTWYEIPLQLADSEIKDKEETKTTQVTDSKGKTTTITVKDFYSTKLKTGEHGYRGEVTLTQTFDQDQLSDLSDDGIINFTLRAELGDITYVSGLLTAELQPNPLATGGGDLDPSAAPIPTPEPSTVALMGLGLAGLGIAGWRRKKN